MTDRRAGGDSPHAATRPGRWTAVAPWVVVALAVAWIALALHMTISASDARDASARSEAAAQEAVSATARLEALAQEAVSAAARSEASASASARSEASAREAASASRTEGSAAEASASRAAGSAAAASGSADAAGASATRAKIFAADALGYADDTAFETARSQGTPEAYRRYLRSYPQGAHAEQAEVFVGGVFRDCTYCPSMAVVPSGRFEMGSPSSEVGRENDEGPPHPVAIGSPLAVGVHEVTRSEFGRFVADTNRPMGDSCVTREAGEWKDRPGWSWRNPGFSQGNLHPVVCVSWEDALAYVRWLSGETGESYRLLSESEWEYAARAETTTRYHWGDDSSSQCLYANGADASWAPDWGVDCDDGYSRTSPVGRFGANAFGLHDVHGNVWEWVQDCWSDNYAGAPGDGSAREWADCARRVIRGGSFSRDTKFLRAANRAARHTVPRNSEIGFRVARTYTP